VTKILKAPPPAPTNLSLRHVFSFFAHSPAVYIVVPFFLPYCIVATPYILTSFYGVAASQKGFIEKNG